MTKIIKFGIEGIAPLLMNRFHEQAEKDLAKPIKRKKTEADTIKEAELKAYKNKKGLFIPAEAVESCLINAVGEIGAKSKKKTEFIRLFKSSVFVQPLELSLNRKNYDLIDKRRGVNPNTKGAVLIKRPLIKEKWEIKGEINIYDESITFDFCEEVMKLAGLRYGLLDYRPRFGRFIIKSWGVKKKK